MDRRNHPLPARRAGCPSSKALLYVRADYRLESGRRVLVSWERCYAPGPRGAPGPGRMGHLTVACRAPGYRSVWYMPRHEPGNPQLKRPGPRLADRAVPGLDPPSEEGPVRRRPCAVQAMEAAAVLHHDHGPARGTPLLPPPDRAIPRYPMCPGLCGALRPVTAASPAKDAQSPPAFSSQLPRLSVPRFRGRYRGMKGSRDLHTLIGIVQVRVSSVLHVPLDNPGAVCRGLNLAAEPQQEVRTSSTRRIGAATEGRPGSGTKS
jgi:hypothetical protein